MARKKYPSDRRRFIMIKSAQLADDTADLSDAEFRTWILLLAEHNELTSQNGEEWIHIAKSRLPSVSPNKRGSVASSARVVRELCTKRSLGLKESDSKWSIQVLKPEHNQATTPDELRANSAQTPGNKNKNKKKGTELYDGTSKEEHGDYRLQQDHPSLSTAALDRMINVRPGGKPFTRHQVAMWAVWVRPKIVNWRHKTTQKPYTNYERATENWWNAKWFDLDEVDEATRWVKLCNAFDRSAELKAERESKPVVEFTQEQMDEADAGW